MNRRAEPATKQRQLERWTRPAADGDPHLDLTRFMGLANLAPLLASLRPTSVVIGIVIVPPETTHGCLNSGSAGESSRPITTVLLYTYFGYVNREVDRGEISLK